MKHSQNHKFWRALLMGIFSCQFLFIGDITAQCNMDFFQVLIGPCEGVTNTFDVNGTIQFSNPPAGGVLTVTANNGINSYDTIINPPFISPQTWSISDQVPANGNPVTYSVTFSADLGCTNGLVANAPLDCSCSAQIGSFTPNLVGSGQVDYVLCFNDEFTLTSTGGFVPPDEETTPPGPVYDPGIGYLVYACPPTIGLIPTAMEDVSDDPCILGVIATGNSFSTINTLGIPPFAGGINNTLYYVPITMYSNATLSYSYVNTNVSCYELGETFAVQYLPEIIANSVPTCIDGSVTVTVSGGLPFLNGSQYMASNLLPLTASFVNTTAVNGGDIVINDLQNGDVYSFDITDDNGCPQTVTGGPFIGMPVANAGFTDTICALTYNLSATPSSGVGAWSGDPGITFVPNVTDPNATADANVAGTYQITWTENNGGGCIDSDDITITFSEISIPSVVTDISCFSEGDGQVIVAPQGGVAPYSYSWTSGGNMAIESNLPQGPTTVTVSDLSGCSIDSTFTITQPTGLTFTTESVTAICNQPTGWAAVINTAGSNGNYVYDWGAGFTNNDTLFNAIPGIYNVTIADNGGIAPFCDSTVTIEVFNTVLAPALGLVITDAMCNTSCDGEAAILPVGTGPFVYSWTPFVTLDSLGVGLCPGPYSVDVTDGNGCTATVVINVGSPPPIVVELFADDSVICNLDSAILGSNISGGTPPYQTYFWTAIPFDPTLDSDTATPVVFPTDITEYTLIVTDANGCLSDPVTLQIDVHPPLEVDVISPINGLDTNICPYVTAFLNLEVMGGDGSSLTYFVFPDLTTPIVLPYAVQPPSDSTYIFIVVDGCILPAIDSVTIGVLPLPTIQIESDPPACAPLEITFGSVGLPPPVDIQWNFGDVNSQDNTGIGDLTSHTYELGGVYDVTVTAVSDMGCVADSTFTNYIEVFPKPVASFTANPRITSVLNGNVRFTDASFANITGWTWDFGDVVNAPNRFEQNLLHLYEDTGTFVVTLLVENIQGCTDTALQEIRINPDFTFYIANTFSPNFDGINDDFRGEGQGFFLNSYEFNIYNRWGDNIYNTANWDNKWDGNFLGGPVENGVYVYRVELIDFQHFEHVYIGHVTVFR
ncbi:MAG: gliding motility-associated-like protein [Granulosicoccus sp.]|jgi:gliding motility-associated-like protein